MSKPIPIQMNRWIVASVNKWFYSQRGATYAFTEGFQRKTENLTQWFEIRTDGPYWDEKTRGEYHGDVEVNILITQKEGTGNAYDVHTLVGRIQGMFVYKIPVYKLGELTDDPENDGCFIGYLTLIHGRREAIKTSFFGKVRPDTAILQATVEGHYRLHLTVE